MSTVIPFRPFALARREAALLLQRGVQAPSASERAEAIHADLRRGGTGLNVARILFRARLRAAATTPGDAA